MTIFKRIFKYFVAIGITIFILLLYSVLIEPGLLTVKHKDLYIPHWNKELDGVKIAVLSDFHLSKYCITPHKLEKIVKKTNKEAPDLIFLLGDLDSYMIERSHFNHEELSDILSGFKSKYGVISVLGNHDYGPGVVKPVLLNANIKVLENQKITKNINDKQLVIYGVKDLWKYNPDPKKIIKKEDEGKPVILLSHNPDIFPNVPDFVSLTLSGHTHGGQIYLPFFGGIFTPSIFEQRYNKGHIVENYKHLFVTSGIGFSVPLRFGNTPEIVILTLYSTDSYPDKKIENTKPLTGIKHSLNAKGASIAEVLVRYFKLW